MNTKLVAQMLLMPQIRLTSFLQVVRTVGSSMASHEPTHIADFFHYFAFGSNLLNERINVQVKGAEFEGVGLLRGHRLVFYDHGERWMGAVASIESSDNDEVWGCVWRVPNSFAAELDKQECGYHRLSVDVRMKNATVTCRTYQYSNPERKLSRPSPHYKHVIVSGASEHALPEHYVQKLKSVDDNGYVGRVKLDLVALKEFHKARN